jgi:hypothetical protein
MFVEYDLFVELAAKRICISDYAPLRLVEDGRMRKDFAQIVDESGKMKPIVFLSWICSSKRLGSLEEMDNLAMLRIGIAVIHKFIQQQASVPTGHFWTL